MQRTDPKSTIENFPPGSVLRRKYRVIKVLGQGGMGTVLEAVHLDLDRRVAIKVLHPDLLDKTELVERFVREGRAASRIEGDHVARVFDVDRLEDETPFLVMEYLDGQDLSYVRRTRAPLPVREAIDYVLQACTAVAQAHAAGVIHRDIKPANLFLAAQPDGSRRIKVLDFGISKITGPLGASEPSVTRTTLVMGSVEYMSPEQMLSTRDVDARTDIWALGVVLFELLTSAPPFTGETPTQVCAHVMSQPAIRPRTLRADIPDAVEAVVLRCLEKDRQRRFSSVEELSRALRAVVAHPSAPPEAFAPPARPVATQQPTTVLDAPLAPVFEENAAPSWQRSQTHVGVASEPTPIPPTTTRAGLWLSLVAVLAGAAVLIGWFLQPRNEAGRPAANNATSVSPPADPTREAPVSFSAEAEATPTVEPTSQPSASAPAASAEETREPAPNKKPGLSTRPAKNPVPSVPAPKPAAKTTKTSGID